MNQSGIGLSSPESHLKSIYHELGAQVVSHRPTYHLPGVDIEYEGEIQKALPGVDVGDVGCPDLVGSR